VEPPAATCDGPPFIPPLAVPLADASGFEDADGDGVPDVAPPLMLMVDADGDGESDGLHADKLGLFIPQQGVQNDRPYFANDANEEYALWFSGGKWWVGMVEEIGRNRGWLKVASSGHVPPRDGWLVYDPSKKWFPLEGMVAVPAQRIRLAGETPHGEHSEKLGTFARCAELHAGRPCFTREGHGGKWSILLWWHQKSGQWVLGRRSDKGKKTGWVRLGSDAMSPVGLTGWSVYTSSGAWEVAQGLACTEV
jgi:hypothetical protein